MTHHDPDQKFAKLVEGQRLVMFTTRQESGALVSRPMTVQEHEGDVFRFIAQNDNAVTREADGQQVNLSVIDGGTYLSISGRCHVERDVAKKRELWNRINEAYADDPEDPNNIILEVTAESGEYWDSGNTVTQLFGIAKAAITGNKPDGDHGTVQL
ncbi:MAG TPA: pyridoxamine 5'-phosphate oxidase family protein [Tessaracoccus flavescens]|uniref:Pyridoxamine 5'-phosphate oxidase family protein n=1 Tax=Tessaracoccus flavescens TaxID=399497 RepID=A0A921EMW7_9ACTN|nr:pyridoxamine 5'-phosphate oxidase family protein [Tessaracoccus flavescens]